MRAIRRLAGEARDAVYASREELAVQAEALSRLETLLNANSQVLTDQSQALTDQSQALTDQTSALTNLQVHVDTREAEHEQLVELLRFVLARGPEARERLRRLRETPDYELPFSESEPLVSVVIATSDNYDLLRTRALPSVLSQTYQNFEVVVIGDAAPDETREVVEAFGDPRFRFSNLPYRGPYPEDPEARWRVVGVPPYNAAVGLARGLWIAPLDDDDAFRPHHLERVLSYARAKRVELAYGRFCLYWENGVEFHCGVFPPLHGNFTLRSSLYHRGLAEIFGLELSDASLGIPSDWGMCRRMMEAGVRMGMLDEETFDYYPSKVFRSVGDSGPEREEQ